MPMKIRLLSTSYLSNNSVLHDRTKYVEIYQYFIREKIDSKGLMLWCVKAQDQVTDIFTKGLHTGDFEKNVDRLDIFDMYI